MFVPQTKVGEEKEGEEETGEERRGKELNRGKHHNSIFLK